MSEMMKCQHCQIEIIRKHKLQKYCCVCNGIVGRLREKEKRREKNQ